MSAMFKYLRARLNREQFLCSRMGIVTSNIYIIRRGLYMAILSIAPRIAGDILDFGCGSKPYESLFRNASSYTGVDIEVSGHSHKDSKVDLYYDGKTLPFPDEHFDAIVSFEVFEHVFNIDEAMSELRRVLKPGGQILITIPFAWDEHEKPYDYARYTSFGIRHIFERHKLEVLELRKTTTYFLAVCQMFIAYFAQYVLPKKKFPARMAQLFLVFPMNVVSLSLNFVLPRRYEYFCNSVILGRKANCRD